MSYLLAALVSASTAFGAKASIEGLCATANGQVVVYERKASAKKYQLTLKELSAWGVENTLSSGLVQVFDYDSSTPVAVECSNIHANNAFFHTKSVHEKMLELKAYAPEIFAKLTLPITIRINATHLFNSVSKFTSGENNESYNDARTYYSTVNIETLQKVVAPETWYFKSKQVKKRRWLPACKVPLARHSSMCEKVHPLDTALIPAVIYHEYIHHLTMPVINQNIPSPLAEGYSSFFEYLLRDGAFKRGLPRSATSIYGAWKPKRVSPYSAEFEKMGKKGASFTASALYDLYQKHWSEPFGLKLSRGLILRSALYVNSNGVYPITHLPAALKRACETVPASFDPDQKQVCIEGVEKWRLRWSLP